jgi:hypothetical protein
MKTRIVIVEKCRKDQISYEALVQRRRWWLPVWRNHDRSGQYASIEKLLLQIEKLYAQLRRSRGLGLSRQQRRESARQWAKQIAVR